MRDAVRGVVARGEQQTGLVGTSTVIRKRTRNGMISDSDACDAGRKQTNPTVAAGGRTEVVRKGFSEEVTAEVMCEGGREAAVRGRGRQKGQRVQTREQQ